ncbi:uncharacterized protein LOC126898284 [Daktulosphaira vitifoliae]|uniref:uncharacterized protein LOC126898284 n=1 Tax=Daktulosphaira vitifoliae TaxID=58002 RepID=UPI0021A9A6ED|nr:uncharacterized protein LOC126898284 [Daktulosphaira vitifoliae]
MSSFLELAQKFNNFYLNNIKQEKCYAFIVNGFQVGLVQESIISELSRYPNIFIINNKNIVLNPIFKNYEERSTQVEKVLRDMKEKRLFVTLKGWRDECYEVRLMFGDQPQLKMDRSATCLFGICNYGVDINGFVKHPTKGLCIWLQQRSFTKQTWPGKWNNMVAGGLSVGNSVLETAYKEGEEEASLSSDLLKNLKSTGTVSFFYESERGLFPDTEFVFDLELPIDFIPFNRDNEVEKFELLTIDETITKLLSSDFKTTSCPVVLDFLVRHAIITPENEKSFPELVELLHVPLQLFYSKKDIELTKSG